MKTNAKIVVGQVLFCVGNDTRLLQAYTRRGEVFHPSACFCDTGLQSVLHAPHLSKQYSLKAAMMEQIQQGSSFFSSAAQTDLLTYF